MRHECFDRTLFLGRRNLETVLAEYAERYNSRRPHRSLDQSARPTSTRLLRSSATSIPLGYEEPITWTTSSMSTRWWHELGGRLPTGNS